MHEGSDIGPLIRTGVRDRRSVRGGHDNRRRLAVGSTVADNQLSDVGSRHVGYECRVHGSAVGKCGGACSGDADQGLLISERVAVRSDDLLPSSLTVDPKVTD